MAKYWAKDVKGNQLSYETESFKDLISSVLENRSYNWLYAQGDDVNIDDFITFSPYINFYFTFINTNFNLFNIQPDSFKINKSPSILFENCEISDFYLFNREIKFFKFSNCKISNLEISKLNNELGFSIEDNTQIQTAIFSDCNFVSFYIRQSKFKNFFFNNSNISNLSIANSFFQKINFSKIIIDNFYFSVSQVINAYFKDNTSIKNDFNFLRNDNKSEFDFQLCSFESKSIEIEKSNVELSFNKCDFTNKLNFIFSDCLDSIVFISRCSFSNKLSFIGDVYKQSTFLKFSESIFNEIVIFDDDFVQVTKFSNSHFLKGLLIPLPLIEQYYIEVHSSVWCILKNQALKNDDKIKALDYRKWELLAYSKEIENIKGQRQERIVLFFNKWSNNHGQSWVRGLVFTLSVWLFSFSLFYLSIDNFSGIFCKESTFIFFEKTFWSNAINFLWLPQGTNELNYGLKNCTSFISSVLVIISFLFGKIFIAYGIFQTISAFRKHGKI